MKRLSLQWRITLMSVLLIGVTCVAMNLLLCSSGVYYMDTIADSLQGGGTVILNDGGAASFDPQLIAPNEELTIVVDGVQGRFRTTNWYITAAVTLLSGILAYFVSGRALKPLRSFTSQVEQVQLNNLADMRINEDAISEFRQLSRSFNQMLERLNNAFSAQRQFTGNAAHELRTPLALMQARLDLYMSTDHGDSCPETAETIAMMREHHTITTDNGCEFAAHLEITRMLSRGGRERGKVYFADSYCSWQKGAIENANKLIRKYIPKKANFDDFSDSKIMKIQKKINRRPREKINFDSPKDRFFKHFY